MESKCSDFHLLDLVEANLLQPCELVHWRKSIGDLVPHEETNETVIFQSHVLCGLGISTSDFFPRPSSSLGDSSALLDPEFYPSHFDFRSSL